jgi:hypothetical protein
MAAEEEAHMIKTGREKGRLYWMDKQGNIYYQYQGQDAVKNGPEHS